MSELELNKKVKLFKSYEGTFLDKASQLIKEGWNLATISDVMDHRLDVIIEGHPSYTSNLLSTNRFNWFSHSFLTGNFAVYHPDEKLKLVTEPDFYNQILDNPVLQLDQNQFIKLPDGMYEKLDFNEYIFSYIKKNSSQQGYQWPKDALQDSLINTLALSGGIELYPKYVNLVYQNLEKFRGEVVYFLGLDLFPYGLRIPKDKIVALPLSISMVRNSKIQAIGMNYEHNHVLGVWPKIFDFQEMLKDHTTLEKYTN